MKGPSFRINPTALTVLAVGLLAWAAVITVIAVLGRDRIVPHFFDDLRIEHFLGFYGIAYLAAAGLPTLKLRHLYLVLIALAAAAEAARWALWRDASVLSHDLVCNIAGIAAALAPIHLARHRKSFFPESD